MLLTSCSHKRPPEVFQLPKEAYTPAGSKADLADGVKDGIKDCKFAVSNCKGLVRRREREREYCLTTEDK